MIFFRSICISFRGRNWTQFLCRMNSTKLTYAQNMSPYEFSLENYDCVGFDLDHTICKYHLKPLFNLIYKTLATYLMERYNYPDSLMYPTEKDMTFAQKGIIFDKCRGNFLKLDHQYKIVKASHGTKALSPEEIIDIYGSGSTWNESKGVPHKLVRGSALDEPFYVFKDYFVTAGAVICAKVIDILDEQNGGKLEEYGIWDQFLDGLLYMYERNNFRDGKGKFFPTLKHNPDLYLQPCSEQVKSWLKSISQQKTTFLLTSANYDSATFLAEYTLGKDWKNYFDIIVTFARKPGFFWRDEPFCIINENVEIAGVKPEDMKSHLIYSQGNWNDLQQVCSILSKVKDPKTVYFGDSLIEDVYAAAGKTGCDTVALVEEMLAEGMESIQESHSDSDVLVSEYWGSFFGIEEINPTITLTLWAYLLSQHSKLAIPNLDAMTGLQICEKISSFASDAPISGYFPGVPKVLSSS